jgi:hypothetical protein
MKEHMKKLDLRDSAERPMPRLVEGFQGLGVTRIEELQKRPWFGVSA